MPQLNLYLIKQNENYSYDTYDSAVVIATSEEEARRIHPLKEKWSEDHNTWLVWDWKYDENGKSTGEKIWLPIDRNDKDWNSAYGTWTHPDHVSVTCIGVATSGQAGDIVISSFNAG